MVAAVASFADRRASPLLAGLAALGLIAGCGSGESENSDDGFDFYVLSLSWSPSYCAVEGEAANRRQCEASHGFVVHGLWPQFEEGWPEFCEPGSDEWVPDTLVEEMLDIMPSAGLIGHQWRKHGSCTGLSQDDYFALTRAAFERVDLPDPTPFSPLADPVGLGATVRAANEGLDGGHMAVACDDTYLREIRICLTHELEFRPCPEVAARACRLPLAQMPPVAQ